MRKVYILLLISIVLSLSFALGDTFKIGQSVASFLKIPVDPQTTGMGDAAIVSFGTPNAIFYNAGNIAWVDKKMVAAGQVQYFSEMKINYFALVVPTSYAVFGIKFRSMDYGDIFRTTEDDIFPSSSTIDLGDMTVGLTVATQATDRLGIGGSINYIKETLDDVEAGGIFFDLGSYYNVGWKTLRFGMALSNYGPAIKYENQSFNMPLVYRLGIAYDFDFSDNIKMITALDVNDASDQETQFNLGLQVDLFKIVQLRGGYKIGYDQEDVTFGVGAGKEIGGIVIGVDYSYQNSKDFDAIQRFGLRLGF